MLRILLFEESHDRAELVREGLARAGHDVVVTIGSAMDLLPAIERSQPDVIVIDTARVRSIIEVAVARFEEFQRMRGDLAEAQQQLRERKLIERAKGLLMAQRGLAEGEAYRALRKLAMQKRLRLGEVARQLIDAAHLLGKA